MEDETIVELLYRRDEGALEELLDQMGDCSPIPAPPIPERVISLRQALFAPSRVRSLEDCEGEISACQIAPYPPGVPVIAPCELIEKKHLAYLREIGYNKEYCDVILEGE